MYLVNRFDVNLFSNIKTDRPNSLNKTRKDSLTDFVSSNYIYKIDEYPCNLKGRVTE